MNAIPGARGSFRWKVVDPTPEGERVQIFTENEILEHYYPRWAGLMMLLPPERQTFGITPLECLRDWVVVNWAERIK